MSRWSFAMLSFCDKFLVIELREPMSYKHIWCILKLIRIHQRWLLRQFILVDNTLRSEIFIDLVKRWNEFRVFTELLPIQKVYLLFLNTFCFLFLSTFSCSHHCGIPSFWVICFSRELIQDVGLELFNFRFFELQIYPFVRIIRE